MLEDYWYEDGLPRVVTVLGDDGLSVVSPWLETYERSKGYFKHDSDITFMSRDSVRTRSDSHDGVEQSLIDAVRDLAIHAMHIDPTADEGAASRDKDGSYAKDRLVRTGGGDQTKH